MEFSQAFTIGQLCFSYIPRTFSISAEAEFLELQDKIRVENYVPQVAVRHLSKATIFYSAAFTKNPY